LRLRKSYRPKNLNKKQLPEIILERKEISFIAESKGGFGVRAGEEALAWLI
jgi:hypothetical protein